jgi:hypothetical protein
MFQSLSSSYHGTRRIIHLHLQEASWLKWSFRLSLIDFIHEHIVINILMYKCTVILKCIIHTMCIFKNTLHNTQIHYIQGTLLK